MATSPGIERDFVCRLEEILSKDKKASAAQSLRPARWFWSGGHTATLPPPGPAHHDRKRLPFNAGSIEGRMTRAFSPTNCIPLLRVITEKPWR